MRLLVCLLVAAGLHAASDSAADLARQIRETTLDSDACYRVREIALQKDDARVYFTDGYLIFTKPLAGRPVAAVFAADVEGGDAEVLLMPPDRSERRSLASHTGSPNLSEHFNAAVLLFSDDTYPALVQEIGANPYNKKVPELGIELAEKWSSVVRNIAISFETRFELDTLSGDPARGFFLLAVSSRQHGNFDVVCDLRSREQITVGQVQERENRAFFSIWTSFAARSFRTGARPFAEPEVALRDFRIEAELDPGLLLRVTTRVKMTPGPDGSRAIPMDISRQMRVTQAIVNGKPAEILQRESMRSNLIRNNGNELFLLFPAEPLTPGIEYDLELRAEGKVVAEAGNHVYYVGARSNWYPSRGMQFAAYDLTFRYPANLDLVSTGDIVADETQGDWRITRRTTAAPIRYAGFNLGLFERTRVNRGPYKVEVCANRGLERALQPPPQPAPMVLPQPQVWGRPRRPDAMNLPAITAPPPPNPTSRMQILATEIASALEFMSAKFGPPPLPSLTVSPVPATFGQGFPGILYLSTLSYLKPSEKAMENLTVKQQTFFSDILQAHETAHQWWGNLVTSDGYHDDWLMEALANYSALMYLEKRKGTRALEEVLEDYRRELLAKGEDGAAVDATGPIVLGPRLERAESARAWRTITYGKGSWIIHMLRRRMGDQRFDSMLAALCRRYARKPLSTEAFRNAAVEFLPPKSPDPKLERFFDAWVYGTGIPALKMTYAVRGKAPALRVTGTVTQTEADPEFVTEAPVEVQIARGRSVIQWVRTSSEPAQFTMPLRQLPLKVTLDPGMAVLSKRN